MNKFKLFSGGAGNGFKLKSQFVLSTKAGWKKLKQVSITLTKPILINSVSNSTNKLHFHCQKVNYHFKIQKLPESLKSILLQILVKRVELLYSEFFSGLFITVRPLMAVGVFPPCFVIPR